jgi:hypothetical protein
MVRLRDELKEQVQVILNAVELAKDDDLMLSAFFNGIVEGRLAVFLKPISQHGILGGWNIRSLNPGPEFHPAWLCLRVSGSS